MFIQGSLTQLTFAAAIRENPEWKQDCRLNITVTSAGDIFGSPHIFCQSSKASDYLGG